MDMKKIYWLLAVLSFIGIAGCEDKNDVPGFDPDADITEERGVAPGEDYTVDPDVKYMDVLYFVPAGIAPADDWHWRVSGVVSHVQQYFGENLNKYYGIEKNFELVRNVANPKYVQIHLVTGKQSAGFYADSVGQLAFLDELVAFYQSNPGVKSSHHHMVIVPEVAGFPVAGLQYEDENEVPTEFFAVYGCDHKDLSMKYFSYDLYRTRYLNRLGEMLYHTAASFGLMNNDAKATDPFRALMSSGLYTYTANPSAVRLTAADALILSENEVFNPKSDEVMYDVWPDKEKIRMQNVDIVAQNSKFVLTCTFMTGQPVSTLLAFHDPWREVNEEGYADEEKEIDSLETATTFDAVLFGTSRLTETVVPGAGYLYTGTIEIPMTAIKDDYKKALKGNNYAKAEFRFKLLFKNGYIYPVDGKCGAYYDDVQVRPGRFRYQYYFVDGEPLIPYRSVTAKDKSAWEVDSVSPEGNQDGGLLFDNQVSTLWKVPFGKDADIKPEVRIYLGEYVKTNGFMVNRGTEKDKAQRITITAWAYDWDVADVVPEIVCNKASLIGSEDMYYYFDYKKDNVLYFSVKIDASEGEESVSLAEVGVY